MRKVTASAVILTALTGCGQNSGIHSTQWSFEIPSEDEISALALSPDVNGTTDSTFASAVDDNRAFTGSSTVGALGSASSGEMMGPAFKQPSSGVEPTAVGLSGRSGLGRSVSRLASTKNNGSVSSSNLTRGYQPVAARLDPVAEVKALLSANGSPSALSNREPYLSNILAPSLPTVYLPIAASATSPLGDPTYTESQVAYADNASFTSAGLPVVEPSSRDAYNPSGNFSSDSSPVVLNPDLLTYQQADYPVSYPAAPVPATLDDGLPVLEASSTQTISASEDIPIGTAILQDLQRTEMAEAVQSLPAKENLNDSINISILPAEVSASGDDLAVGTEALINQSIDVSASIPTLESLRRSVVIQEEPVVRETSPLIAYVPPATEADLAVDSNLVVDPNLVVNPNLVVEAIAVAPAQSDFPTLESLLETMPETAARPNFAVELPDGGAASPLLKGFSSTQPLSTLYLPIPEATSESDADATLSANVSLVRDSLASLADRAPAARTYQAALSDGSGSKIRQVTSLPIDSPQEMLRQRNRAALSLIDKLSTKRRQIVTY